MLYGQYGTYMVYLHVFITHLEITHLEITHLEFTVFICFCGKFTSSMEDTLGFEAL